MSNTADIALVRRFFERWAVSFEETCAAFEDTMAEDCVWDQKPMALTTGPQGALRFLRRARSTMGLERIEVELISIVAAAGIVHTQRVDRLYARSGALLAAAAVAGVLHLRDGRITQWKEYFDAGSFVADTLRQGLRRLSAGLRR
jgi:limonene-1,2-epoxide hydrolase